MDYTNPYDNLYAFGKIWAGYDTPIIGAFHGLMYGKVDGQRLKPLFGYAGTGVMLAKIDDNGDLLLKSRETGYFTDLETGEVLEHWHNPYTGETNEVYHFYNDVTVGRVGPTIPEFLMDSAGSPPTLMNEGTVFADKQGKYPFILPFQQYGDDMMLAWDYTHEYANPVTQAGWPRASTGAIITPSEHFTMQVSKAALEDRSLPTARMTAGFSRTSPWWPFMRMGGTGFENGMMFGRMFSHNGLKNYDDIPRKILDYIERHAPDQLTLPDIGWETKMDRMDTWKAYAKDIKPENQGYSSAQPDNFIPPTGSGKHKAGWI